VSEFAPVEYQRFLSYVVGWMSMLSWQAGNAADCFLTGTIAQALIVVNNPDYEPQRWQGTLFVFAMVGRFEAGLRLYHVLTGSRFYWFMS
jgi:hypothetical protein